MRLLILITFLLLSKINIAQCWQIISNNYGHTIAIDYSGKLWAWGDNTQGQIGNGSIINSYNPILIDNGIWIDVSAGGGHSLAIKSDGTLWAWGDNNYGQLGDGTNIDKLIPTQVGTDNDWSKVIGGYNFCSFAIKTNQSLWGWGINTNYQLGDSTDIDRNSPTRIGNDYNWDLISTSKGSFTMGIKSDGTLWGWGNNALWQLGQGLGNDVLVPTQTGTDNDWKNVSCGFYHSIGIKYDGTLWAWGWNDYGELGDGTTLGKTSPIQVGTNNNWEFTNTGQYHNIAIKSDGTLWGWGNNFYGQLGDGTNIDRLIPTQIGTDNDWLKITSGLFQSFAIKNDLSNWAWGNNFVGVFGNGGTQDTNYPLEITCTPLGLENYNSLKFSAYPNPTNLVFSIVGISNNELTLVEIFDITGKLVLTSKSTLNIDISTLDKGTYFYKVNSIGSSIGKIIKN